MDNLTLAAANAFILLYYSINLLITSITRKSKPLRFVSLGFLILALAFFVVVVFAKSSTDILALVFNLSFSLFFFLYFAGIRSFCGFKAWPAKYSFLLTSGYSLLTLVIILVPDSFPRIAITSLLVVYLFGDLLISIRTVWRSLPLVNRILTLAGLIGYPLYLLVRLVIVYHQAYADKFFTDNSVESTVTQIFMMVNFSVLATVAMLIDNHVLMTDLRLKNELLDQHAITDPLTGLFNRRYLDQNIGHEIIRKRNERNPVSLILLDIDCFKLINDRYGSHQGDLILRDLTALIQMAAHARDLIVRIDGARILLILSGKNKQEALLIAEKLRLQIETQPTPRVCPFTASFGVSEHEIGESFEHWLRRTAQALLQAKKNGRNRVVSAA